MKIPSRSRACWPGLRGRIDGDRPCGGVRLGRRHGFTLIELLVAAAVSMLLVVLLLAATQGITGNYSKARARVLQTGDASLALDQMVQDIEGMVIPNFALGEGLRIARDPSQPAGLTNAMWFSLLTAATDSDDSAVPFQGASRAVSYRIAYQNPVDATTIVPPAYALYRSVASAAHTFRNIGTNTTNQQSQYWSSLPASPSPAPRPPTDRDNFLAENIVAFQVRFLRADNHEWTLPGQDVRVGRDGSTVDGQPVEGGFLRAEVSITVLTSEGAQRVQDGVLTVDAAVEKFGKTFVRQTSVF